jgi:hypothetical protein
MARAFAKRAKQASSSSNKSRIPQPFTQAPDSLSPFLQRLNPAQVHITHIDRHPPEHKRTIFLIPVLLNGGIALLLLWRLRHAAPFYYHLVRSLLGQINAATVDLASTTRTQQLLILLRRTAVFLFDFLFFRFAGPWPLTFFLEQPVNPCVWRWRLGYQREEVVVRIGRGWTNGDLVGKNERRDDAGRLSVEGSPFWKVRVLPAVATAQMSKTGYLLMDRSWDLDFELMCDAHALVKQGQISLRELDKVVFAHIEQIGWVVWRWEGDSEGAAAAAGGGAEEKRKKVVAFKETLTAAGKESLFWTWTEIVEEERDLDGGFSSEKQARVAARVKKAFAKEGLDFDAVVEGIGGLDELPLTTEKKT